MLNCRARPWRCLRLLQHDVPLAFSSSLRRSATTGLTLFAAQHQQRLFLRTSVPSSEHQLTRPSDTPFQDEAIREHGDPWKASTQAQSLKKKATKVIKRDPSISPTDYSARLRELKYLPDPMKLADFVRDKLKQEKQKEMLDLVRVASKNMVCTVAWNHLMDDRMARGQISIALKIYNEMKKRAQIPDSHTYLLLLRGLANNAHNTSALTHALSIYHSMSAPNSKVPPAIIHTNAVLKVCSRANNMDALWGVASKIPERGPGAANNLTFTTILNALRQSLLVGVPVGSSEEEMAARKEEAVVQGRRIWEDVIGKWRAADIFMDEELVCAMGRLLLVGSRPRDWDDVLSLIEQTMNIPRLVPRLGSQTRAATDLPLLRAPSVPEAYRGPDEHDMPYAETPRGEEFLSLVPKTVGGSTTTSPLIYAKPSNNTLSLIQEACLKIVTHKASTDYWNLLTDPQAYAIVPDLNNLHMRLRLLRQNRASHAALETLQNDIVGRGTQPFPGTFRIAMSACVRDKNNRHALSHATAILDLMMMSLPDADAKVVAMYADMAFDAPPGAGNAVVAALEKLEQPLKSLRTQLTLGAERRDGMAGAQWLQGEKREDALGAVSKVYRLHDRLLLKGEVAGEEATMWKARRARLSSFINRMAWKDGQREERKEKEKKRRDVRDEFKRVQDGEGGVEVEVKEAWEMQAGQGKSGQGEKKEVARDPFLDGQNGEEKRKRYSEGPRPIRRRSSDRPRIIRGRMYREAKGAFSPSTASESPGTASKTEQNTGDAFPNVADVNKASADKRIGRLASHLRTRGPIKRRY